MLLGAQPRFKLPEQHEQEDEEELELRLQNQAKAWWILDKACKNFLRVCWRRRSHIIGKHFIAKQALVPSVLTHPQIVLLMLVLVRGRTRFEGLLELSACNYDLMQWNDNE